MVAGNPLPSTTLPDPMDVVWCRFPYDERRGVPGPEAHPGLIFETREYRPGEYSVLVAFGTSNTERPLGPHFTVENYAALHKAGLNKVTLFDLGRWLWLPWTDGFFTTPDDRKWSTPRIGHLTEECQEDLAEVLRHREALGMPNPPRPK